MRNGYILLHRQGLTKDEWKHPLRTLAWIDFLTMAAWEEHVADDGVHLGRGEVIASYGFLATRWHVSKDTAFCWMKHWIAERQVERRTERCTERHAERFFVVNYAKYQDSTERLAERPTERPAERTAEQMKRKEEPIQEKENSEIASATERKGPHPGVQAIMDAMQKCFGRMDDSQGRNRQYAWHLLKMAMKERPGEEGAAVAGCVDLIRAAAQHPFWGKKITKVETIFRNANRIANDLREQRGQKIVSI
jgi:hypothetical protein